jgi:hypothetical protein
MKCGDVFLNSRGSIQRKVFKFKQTNGSLTWVVPQRLCLRGGADKSLGRPTSRCPRTESMVSLEFMYRIASLFLLQRLKGSMSGDARNFNNMETIAVIKSSFPLQGKAPK